MEPKVVEMMYLAAMKSYAAQAGITEAVLQPFDELDPTLRQGFTTMVEELTKPYSELLFQLKGKSA